MLSGFVAEVDHKLERSLFCLFEPNDVDMSGVEVEVVSAAISDIEVMKRLRLALKANPTIKPWWVEALKSRA